MTPRVSQGNTSLPEQLLHAGDVRRVPSWHAAWLWPCKKHPGPGRLSQQGWFLKSWCNSSIAKRPRAAPGDNPLAVGWTWHSPDSSALGCCRAGWVQNRLLETGQCPSPASALTSQEERQEGSDPAPADCRAPRDGREDQRNSALGALLQEVLSPRQEHTQLIQPFHIC